jgi:hypothetical protein
VSPQILLLECARKCPADRRDEMDIIDRFLDKVFRSRLDRRYRHRNVGMTRYENDRKGDLSATKFPDEFDAVRAGRPHVTCPPRLEPGAPAMCFDN